MIKSSKIIILLIFVAIAIVAIISIRYYQFLKTEDVPIKNLRVLSTSDCFIYLNVKYKKEKYVIVCPNGFLYNAIRSHRFLHFYPHKYYVYKFGSLIKKDTYYSIGDSLFNSVSGFIIDENLRRKYSYNSLLKDTSIIIEGRINYNLDFEDKMAIVYELLKNGVNCCYPCEAGLESIYMPSFQKDQKHLPPKK